MIVGNTTTMTMTRTADDEAAAVASSSASTTAMQDRINKMITMQRLQSDVARERMTASAVANAAAVSEAGGVNNDSVNGNKVAAAKSADSSSSSSSSSLRIVLPSPRWTIRREDTDVTKDIISQRVVTTRDDSSFWTAAGSQQSMMTAIASNNIDRFMGEKETSISTSTMKMKKENNLQP